MKAPRPDIAALLARLKFSDHGLHERQLIHPRRDWMIGVCLMLLVVVSTALWSAGNYLSNRDISDTTEEIQVTAVVYRGSQVEAVLETYDARAKAFAAEALANPRTATSTSGEERDAEIEVEESPAIPETASSSEADVVSEDISAESVATTSASSSNDLVE